MSELPIFFKSYCYLKNHISSVYKNLEENIEPLEDTLDVLLKARKDNKKIIVDGQGRSFRSLKLVRNILVQNKFEANMVKDSKTAILRPLEEGDVLLVNSGSGETESPVTHIIKIKKEKTGIKTIGIIGNENSSVARLVDHKIILKPKDKKELKPGMHEKLAPLGTEFEISSAAILSCFAYSINKNKKKARERFEKSMSNINELLNENLKFFKKEKNTISLDNFVNLISNYIPTKNKSRVYFLSVGRDKMILDVASIRYNHLYDGEDKDLIVLNEEEDWLDRKKGDLLICASGSGNTKQIVDYAYQAKESKMNLVGITSFENSELGFAVKDYKKGLLLIVPGRKYKESRYNKVVRGTYVPYFELALYVTLDALLTEIADRNNITEEDMKKAHKDKILE